MSTPLQRMVDRARGTQHRPALRIEPLFGSTYAASTEAVHTSLPEVDIEVDAAARMPAGNSSTLPDSNDWPATAGRPDVSPDGDAQGAARVPGKTSQAPLKSGAAMEDERATVQLARSLPGHAVTDAVYRKGARSDALQVAAKASPVRAPHAPVVQVKPPKPAAPAKSQRDAMASTAITPEAGPNITISIGHVEVRNAPTPTSAPRRPSFRPGVSLDSFLRRGRGDG